MRLRRKLTAVISVLLMVLLSVEGALPFSLGNVIELEAAVDDGLSIISYEGNNYPLEAKAELESNGLTADGKRLSFILMTKKVNGQIIDKDMIRMQAVSDGTVDGNVNCAVEYGNGGTGPSNKKLITVTFPENIADVQKTYTLKFHTKGDDASAEFSDSPFMTVTLKAGSGSGGPSTEERYPINIAKAPKGVIITTDPARSAAKDTRVRIDVLTAPDAEPYDEITVTSASGKKLEVTKGEELLSTYYFIMPNEAVTVKAGTKNDNPIEESHNVTVKQIEGATVSALPSGKVKKGEPVQMGIVVAATDKEFDYFTCNGIKNDGDIFIMPDHDVEVSAVLKNKSTAPTDVTGTVVRAESEELVIENGMDTAELTVIVSPKNIDNDNIRLAAMLNGEKKDIQYKIFAGASAARRKIILIMPKNEDTTDKEYIIGFNGKGSDAVFDDPARVKVIVKGRVKTDVEFASITATNNRLPLSGGDTNVSVGGKNFNDTMTVKVFKKNSDTPHAHDDNVKLKAFYGEDNIRTAELTFPPVDEDTVYVVEMSQDGKRLSTEITLSSSGTLAPKSNIFPKTVYSTINDNENILYIKFHEPIFETYTDAIRNGLNIVDGNDSHPMGLTNNDKITINDATIKVEFAGKVLDDTKLQKVTLDERCIKNADGDIENYKFSVYIRNNIAVATGAEFVSKDVFDYRGGRAIIKLSGGNLPANEKHIDEKYPTVGAGQDKNMYVKVLKNEPLNEQGTREGVAEELIAFKGDDKEKEISFTVPENKTDRVITYTCLISVDGGFTYDTDMAATLENRARKLIVAVFPKGENDLTKPALSFAKIHSYGATEGGENINEGKYRDITHTDLPTNQESKKTFIDIYGANLKATDVRFRLKDKNGVYWIPIHDSSKDSTDRILMTMKDGNGITGEGGHLYAEVILPNDYMGDIEWSYEMAIDGVNFDREVTVSAKVVDDGVTQKDLDSYLVKDIVVRHVDEKGKDIIAPYKINAYRHLPPKVFFFELNQHKSITDKLTHIDGYIYTDNLKYTDETSLGEMWKSGDNGKEGEVLFKYTTEKKPDTPKPTPEPEHQDTPYHGIHRPMGAVKHNDKKEAPSAATKKIILALGSSVLRTDTDGKEAVTYMDVPPLVQNERIILPIRYVAEAMGFNVEWIQETRTVVLSKEGLNVQIPIDTDTIIVNGAAYKSDVRPLVQNRRTYLSVSNIAKAIGLKEGEDIIWHQDTKQAEIIVK